MSTYVKKIRYQKHKNPIALIKWNRNSSRQYYCMNLANRTEKKLNGNYMWMLLTVLNKSLKHHLIKNCCAATFSSNKQIPPTSMTNKHCLRRDELTIFTDPSARAGYDTRSIFKQSLLLFTHSWRDNYWIHTFPKGISAMWNAISLVQDLNSYRRVYSQRR